jgi:hypothetical protein
MSDEIRKLAIRDEVRYFSEIKPEQVYPYFYRKSPPQRDVFHATNRAIALKEGIVPIDTETSVILAVNPLQVNLNAELRVGTMAEFLQSRFLTSLEGVEEVIEDELIGPLNGRNKKLRLPFAYTSSEQIERVIEYFVPGYTRKKQIEGECDRNSRVQLNHSYHMLADYLSGKNKIIVPSEIKAFKPRRSELSFEDLCRWENIVPLSYSSNPYPTIVWAVPFTYTPFLVNGIFDTYDNYLEGEEHIEHRICLDDLSAIATIDIVGLIADYVFIKCSDEEALLFSNPRDLDFNREQYRKREDSQRRVENANPQMMMELLEAKRNKNSYLQVVRNYCCLDEVITTVPSYISRDLFNSSLMGPKNIPKTLYDIRRVNGLAAPYSRSALLLKEKLRRESRVIKAF